ncbi:MULTISPECIES: TetR/AcrR family transcriptional regulator [Pseudonocardia]|uniref:TetR family transcriptional regulator n=2 Tax=Pseudonocardia TaxID=1847 RepID=A0ABQ0RVG4_9PSEU|nr:MULTISPECIES: TetR/AcrR family transcriptional regulator [Pseudonocardia]OSY40823.1 putative HTH-type transcriptional regulator YfiR [Pseudonocardia autotrophica]TDN71869.1 TetR family transcriptional regulator [Pseudonocardia autotrophica]BBG02557.1 TetR family transcriptional regulator [Pseudonocardia autotrophica]GEC24616.1 TetR family transcriptional regulator [Pseudonocardia saturnea]
MSDAGAARIGGPADEVPPIADTSGIREPTTRRGARTRATLVAAARTVFERDGYLTARLSDITAEAGCSIGTFYTYFTGKDEIFAAVLEAAQDDMLHPGMPHVADDDDPAAVIEASNRAYLVAFRRNAKLMALMHQVAAVDPAFRELRRRRGRAFAERNARRIAELQQRGQADPGIDPLQASYALSGMVSRMAMDQLVGEGADLEELVTVLTRLWINGLRLTDRSGEPAR